MKLMIIGATGRTGEELMRQAISAGHEVVAYVRRPEAIAPRENLIIVGGELDNQELLKQTAEGCDAITVTLGPKISDRNRKLMEIAVPAVIKAAKSANVDRVVVLSALGVGETYNNTRYPYRLGTKTFLKGNFSDHDAGESKLKNSGLNWTTIHPGPLFNGEKTEDPIVEDAKSGYKMPGAPRTYRSDVAAVILKILEDSSTYNKQIIMTSAQQTKG